MVKLTFHRRNREIASAYPMVSNPRAASVAKTCKTSAGMYRSSEDPARKRARRAKDNVPYTK